MIHPFPHLPLRLPLVIAILLSATFVSAQEPPPSPPAPVAVHDFGAVGDGINDDGPAIQRALDAACVDVGAQKDPTKRRSRIVLLPPGTYRVTKPLRLLPRHMNLVLQGTGGAAGDPDRANTQIVWDGVKGGVLLDAYGVFGLQLRDLLLDGRERAGVLLRVNSLDSANQDPAILELPEHRRRDGRKGAYGIRASGVWSIERVRFINAQTGMECGGDSWTCAADMTLVDVTFSKCSTGFASLADQNLNYAFVRPNVAYCDIGLHFRNGGSVSAAMLNGHSCGVAVKIEKGGINAGAFDFSGVRVEARTYQGRRTRLFDVAGETNVRISSMITTCMGLTGDHLADENAPGVALPLIRVDRGAMVLVQASLLSGPLAEVRGGGWLAFDNCRFRVMADPRRDVVCEDGGGYVVTDSIVIPQAPGKQSPYASGDPVMIREFRHSASPETTNP